MKKYKVKDVLQMLKKDGWYLARTKGDHRQFKHPSKPGTVTIKGKESEVLNQFLLNSIWHQAGWKYTSTALVHSLFELIMILK